MEPARLSSSAHASIAIGVCPTVLLIFPATLKSPPPTLRPKGGATPVFTAVVKASNTPQTYLPCALANASRNTGRLQKPTPTYFCTHFRWHHKRLAGLSPLGAIPKGHHTYSTVAVSQKATI